MDTIKIYHFYNSFLFHRIFVGFFFLCFFFVLLNGCRSARNATAAKTAKEDFKIFYEKFLTDSAFQLKRINFPLPGINTAAMELEDSIYYWKTDNWPMLKEPEIDPDIYTRRLNITDTLVTDEIFIENSGFYIKSVFRPVKRKWFLTYFVDSNL